MTDLISEESVNDRFYRPDRQDYPCIIMKNAAAIFWSFLASLSMSIFMSLRICAAILFVWLFFFPLVFACTDVINELYGYNRVKRIICSAAVYMDHESLDDDKRSYWSLLWQHA